MSNMNEHLKAYIDGELPGNLAREVEQALQRDAALRKEFDEMRRISSTMREANVVPAVSGLEKTLSALAKNQKPVRPPILRLLPALGLIGTCAIALVVVGRWNSGTPPFHDEFPMAASKKPELSRQPAETMAMEAVGNGVATKPEMSAGVEWKKMNGKASTPYLSNEPQGGGADAFGGGGRLGEEQDFTPGEAGENRENSVGTSLIPVPATKGRIAQKVVKTGDLGLEVKDAKGTVEQTSNLTKRLGGLVDTSNLSGDEKSGMTGNMVLRVPVAKFDIAMAELQKMGKVTGISSSAKDVTADMVGNDARLKTMANQETAYQKILTGARRVDDVLSVKDRLDNVQQEIATLTATQKALKDQAAMSTISLSITQPALKPVALGPVREDWLNKSWSSAWITLSAAGRKITEALIYLVVFCPVWIPIVVLANLFSRRLRQAV